MSTHEGDISHSLVLSSGVGPSSMVSGADVRIVGLIWSLFLNELLYLSGIRGSFVLKNGQPKNEDNVITSHISYFTNKMLNLKDRICVLFRYFPCHITHFSKELKHAN